MKNKTNNKNKEVSGLMFGIISGVFYYIIATYFGFHSPSWLPITIPTWAVSVVLSLVVFLKMAVGYENTRPIQQATATQPVVKTTTPVPATVQKPAETATKKPAHDNETKKSKQTSSVTLSAIAGYETTKKSMQFMVECLKNPDLLTSAGAQMPSGILLYGPPGTGKTMFAKAVAGEASVPFLSVSGSDFMEKFVGVGAQRVRELFANARNSAPCIVFIDEIDAVGKSREGDTNDERQQTLNQLLVEMADIASSHSSVMVMAATNNFESLDSALTRPGRFDRKIAVPLPDQEDRLAILKLHMQNKKSDSCVDLNKIAQMTSGMAGADLATLVNEAAIQAVYHGRDTINEDDLDTAFFQQVTGGEKSEIANPEELRVVAYHEAGHTIVAKLLTNDEIPQVSIIGSTSGALGYTMRYTAKDSNLMTKKQIEGRIQSLYGGRAAEEIFFGNYDDVTTGASGDLKQAGKMIRSYFSVYGMGENTIYTDDTSDVNAKSKELANRLYKATVELLKENRSVLDALADALVEKKTLTGAEVDEILSK